MARKDFKLRGSCVALPTPFRYGTVDFLALEALCHRQIDHGTAALAPCGTTGEAPLLTPGEHHRVVAATVAAAAGRVPVIAGAGSNNTQAAVELAQSAELAGAQALLCVTPYYLKPTQAGLMQHFQAIHDPSAFRSSSTTCRRAPPVRSQTPRSSAWPSAHASRASRTQRVISRGSAGCVGASASASCCCPATTRPRRRFDWPAATAASR